MQRHITDGVDFSKFGIPSWRIEQRYSPGVLIGNWSEERYRFPATKYKHNTTYSTEFKNYGTVNVDVNVRRTAKLNSEGIPRDILFHHHGTDYHNMFITLYDEHYNGRWREKNLPPLRKWDKKTLSWMPEQSDHPLKGASTKWGLKEEKDVKDLKRQEEEYRPDFESTYMYSYQEKPVDGLKFTRFATPKHLSTTLLPSNKIINNLHLRGKQTLRMPEVMPQELTQISI